MAINSQIAVSDPDSSTFASATIAVTGFNVAYDTLGVTLNGSTGNETITGSSQADVINAGKGADFMTGGAGRDTFVFASTDSTLSLAAGTPVTIQFTPHLIPVNRGIQIGRAHV